MSDDLVLRLVKEICKADARRWNRAGGPLGIDELERIIRRRFQLLQDENTALLKAKNWVPCEKHQSVSAYIAKVPIESQDCFGCMLDALRSIDATRKQDE